MTWFDWMVVAVVALSALTALARGIVRSLIALVAWVVGLIAAIAWTPTLGGMLPQSASYPFVPYLVVFVLIFIAALVAGALIAMPLRAIINAAGLDFVDRSLGAVFGLARGAVLIIAFTLIAGLTTLPGADWWQNSLFAPTLARSALTLAPWLPRKWADDLDYSGRRAVSPLRPASLRHR